MKYLSEPLEWKGYHWKSGLPPGIELFLYTTHLSLGLDHLFAIVPVAEKGFHLSSGFNLETLPPSSDSTGFIAYNVYEA